MLVPLTASLYVRGTLDDADKVLVDVGTGYFIEVSEFFLSNLCIWCSVIQFWGVCSMYGEFMFYVWFWFDLIDRFWMLFPLGTILVCYTIHDHHSCLACDATLCFSCIYFVWKGIWWQRGLFHFILLECTFLLVMVIFLDVFLFGVIWYIDRDFNYCNNEGLIWLHPLDALLL